MNPLDHISKPDFREQGRFRWNNYLFQVPRFFFFKKRGGEAFFWGGDGKKILEH